MIDPAGIRNRIKKQNITSQVITSDVAVPALTKYEAFHGEHNKNKKTLVLGGGVLQKSNIDISWLKAASDTYDISDDPKDYCLVDIPIVTVCIPNRNMQAFPYEETSFFDPMLGCIIYQSFIGKATNIDHINQDPLKAKGVIFDASLEFIPAYDVWKIRTLAGFDRTKDPKLADEIITGERPGFSMGAVCGAFVCSICGAIDTNINPCSHLDPNKGGGKGSLWDAKSLNRIRDTNISFSQIEQSMLAYQLCISINFFEISSVLDPADSLATIKGAEKPLWV